MADKIIGSLIYGEHELPKKYRPWKERLKVPLGILTVLLVISGLLYKFANYREERRVAQFLEAVNSGNYDAAYAEWDSAEGSYTMEDFLVDWDKDGYYMKGTSKAEIADSNSDGGSVIVYVTLASFTAPIALSVDKETLKLSFSPTNKYDLTQP